MSTVVALATPALIEAVGEVPGVETVLWDGRELPDRAAEVELVVAPYNTAGLPDLSGFPRLRVVQVQSAGYDGMVEQLPPGVALANATGVHDDATAELALGVTLASLRGIDDAVRNQGRWIRDLSRRSLADSRVLVLGYGSIGRAVAERMLACKAVVTGVASRPRPDDLLDSVHGPDDLPRLLPETDVLVVVLPLSEATRHVVDDAFLAQLPDGALVVNVGRGPLLDTDAVLAHAGRLRFALDVTDPEPLPPEHPLWQAPGVLITPHVAGGTTAMLPRMAALARAQIEAYVAGEPLRNVVHAPDAASS
ncbi:2-hydroxyacid dehydrogenase [Nocardioides campestrisoli]|uniref:2-hydroxyacid dehydrogenase n=1 Tax=Nocardioides campestrisoli TaxID=2736757 RepID=UPI0015E73C37|nr:2-hydroxyacid dehydrogenase [Nocardioides campestrisoli]